MERIFIRFVLLVAGLFLAQVASAGIAVIVHASVNAPALSAQQVSQIFLGREQKLPGGTAVVPLDMAEGSDLHVRFAERALGKTEQQLRGYWTRMIFTGKGQPPRAMGSSDELLRMVSSAPGYIGYVDAKDAARANVKVLYTID